MSGLAFYPSTTVYPRQRPHIKSDLDRNVFSGIICVVVVVVVCASISQPQWFWLDGGGCNKHSIGLYLFFHPGEFQAIEGKDYGPATPRILYYTNGEVLKLCVTPEIVSLIRMVIGITLFMICCSLGQMLLDIYGPSSRLLKCLRRNAFLSILTVLLCVVAVGLCYYITTIIETQQEATKPINGPNASARVQVKLDIGFYLLIFAGGMSVVAVGCNWLRPSHIFHDSDSAPLMDEWGDREGLEHFTHHQGGSVLSHLPYHLDVVPPPPVEGHPPPPYTP